MRKILFTALIFLAVTSSFAGRVYPMDIPREYFEEAVEELESFFPAVDGYVVSVVAGTIYTDISGEAKLQPGTEMLVYREGDEIVHPMTGQVLGRYETKLGVIRISQIREDYATGNVVEKGEGQEIKPGDRVRITSARLRLAVAGPDPDPLYSMDWTGWQNELFFSLERSSRFYPVDLVGQSPLDPEPTREQIKEAAAAEDLGAVIIMKLSGPPGNNYLGLQIYSGITGSHIATARIDVGERPRRPDTKAPEATGTSVAPAGRTPSADDYDWETLDLDYKVVSACSGKLTGADRMELALTDGRSIYIYSRDSNDGWGLLLEQKGRAVYQILSVDCGDIDGNGKDEIFSTRISSGILRSEVLEYEGGLLVRKHKEKNLFYRVVKNGDEPGRLFAQIFNPNDLYGPPVMEYVWSGGDYVPLDHEKIGIPSVYGLGLADINGDGEVEILYLNANDHLEIYSPAGERIWSSEELFGGPSLFIDSETLGQDLPNKETGGYLVRGRILSADITGDRSRELVLFRNISKVGSLLRNIRVYSSAELGIYGWDGLNLIPAAPPEKFRGYVADYAIARGPGGFSDLVLAVNLSRSFGREKGKLLSRPLVLPPREQ